ncbi:MAG: IclR family transcriptional regulator [Jatrophihabitantaceae bacterium]
MSYDRLMAQVPAAAQTIAILRYLARQAGPVPAGSITRDLRLPRSTTYHLLATLQAEGFVVHFPEDRRYALGIGAYELGSGYTRQAPLQRLARVPLSNLVDRTRHSAHLAVLHGRDVVYVIEERAPGRPHLVTDVDVRLPAHSTASGRAMLAALPAQQVRALFPDQSAFVQRTERGPQSPSALRQLLVAVRRDGFAFEDSEVTRGWMPARGQPGPVRRPRARSWRGRGRPWRLRCARRSRHGRHSRGAVRHRRTGPSRSRCGG